MEKKSNGYYEDPLKAICKEYNLPYTPNPEREALVAHMEAEQQIYEYTSKRNLRSVLRAVFGRNI